MKSIKINYHSKLENTDIKEVADFFDQNLSYEYIDMLNWPTLFPYKPDCRFKVARSTDSLFLHFKVIEKDIVALYGTDHDPVWKDSCVEFFCKLPDQKSYFNFEFNCIGTCLATRRDSRTENIIPFNKEQMSCIKRHASLGRTPFEAKSGNFEWKLTIEIPLFLIGVVPGQLPETIKANFYKCADDSQNPHYLSWSLVATPEPDFHCPDYFGELSC